MKENSELKRQWQEKAPLVFLTLLSLFFMGHHILHQDSSYRILIMASYTLFFGWWTILAFTKPDALIKDEKLYIFKRLTPKPLEILLSDIHSIERHSEFPIWRVSPLLFNLKNDRLVTFSTGGNEARMKRIMQFIETKTTLRIINK